MKITNCQTNHMTNPLGYQLGEPVFSYQVSESQGKKQKQARIRVALDEDMVNLVHDSGWSTNISSLAYACSLTLKARTRYYWQVSVQSDAQEEATSDINWFETGKCDEDWSGKWITTGDTDTHPIFVKQLPVVDKPIASARLYLCGLGLYEAYLGEQKIGEELLAPYCNNYHQWLQYQTYDITKDVQEKQTLSILLGNGWYKGRFGFDRYVNHQYGDRFRVIAEVYVTYQDGSQQVIGTDDSWDVYSSQITESSIYDGEVQDYRKKSVLLGNAQLDTQELTSRLQERLSVPVRVQEILHPVEMIQTPAGETVLDLGQNMAGIFSLKVDVPEGQKIHLQFGEILQNGNFYRDNLRSAQASFTYISDGKVREIRPHFTFYGYRYVKVEGIDHLAKEDFSALVLYSDLPQSSQLSTGHEKVNQLISNTSWGMKSNFIDIPMDCPQRDERMGWTGDAQVFSATATFMRDTYAFYRKYLYDCWQEQQQFDGKVPDMIPSAGNQGVSSVWGDAAVIIPWNLYLFYGDKAILENQFDSMKAWVDYVCKVDGDNHAWRNQFHYGDWLALDNFRGKGDNPRGGTAEEFIASVYYYNSVDLLAKSADIIGKPEDALHYQKLAKDLLQAIQEEYYSPNGRCVIQTQTAAILTLKHHLVENLEPSKTQLKTIFEQNDYQLETGFVGTPLLCPTLSEHGFSDIAFELLLRENYPSWLYAINLGATTIWERWNSVEPDGSISSTGMNSLNHYAYGSIVEWLYRYVAGLQPLEDAPGFKKVRIAPSFNWQLQQVHLQQSSPAGEYQISWEILNQNHVRVSVTVPFDCQAEVLLPFINTETLTSFGQVIQDGQLILGAGQYVFDYETTASLKKVLTVDNTLLDLFRNEQARSILLAMNPDMAQLSDNLKAMTLRQLIQQFSGNSSQTEIVLEQLNQALSQV